MDPGHTVYILGVRTFAANNVAKLKLGVDSTRGKVLGKIMNYWLHLLCMDS
jgi:hypothetical protein